MQASMRVSVVVPTFNASGRLRTTILSVLAQSVSPLEIIVVDDGSTDDTAAVCAGFGRAISYLKVDNGGQQRARNLGVQQASGEWIALLDHDDLWHPGYLAELAALHGRHDFDLALCNSQTVQESVGGALIKDSSRFIQFAPPGYWQTMGADPADRWSVLERYDFAHYLAFHPAQPSVMTIRKHLYQRLGGYDPRLRGSSAENFEFEIRALRLARVGLIWTPLVTITRHATNASVDGSKMAMDLVNCLRFALQVHDLTADETDAVNAELQRRLPNAMHAAFILRRFPELRRYQIIATATPDLKTRIKCAVAKLPEPIAGCLAAALTR